MENVSVIGIDVIDDGNYMLCIGDFLEVRARIDFINRILVVLV